MEPRILSLAQTCISPTVEVVARKMAIPAAGLLSEGLHAIFVAVMLQMCLAGQCPGKMLIECCFGIIETHYFASRG